MGARGGAANVNSGSTPLDALDVISASHYAEFGYPHEAWTRLRAEAPLHLVESPHGRPFWAVTRHEDITRISREPHRFLNAPRLTVVAEGAELPVRMLLNMDPPEHHGYRSLINRHFTPRALGRIAGTVDGIATAILDELITEGSEREIDFVGEVSALLPIRVIAEILGVPRCDWEKLFDWTNQTVGAGDPEYQVEGRDSSGRCRRP